VDPILAEGIDLTSPVALLFGGLVVLAGVVALLWRVSRGDSEARLAAALAELGDARKREADHIAERASWAETQLRSAKAQESSAEAQSELAEGQRAILARLESLERRVP